MDTSVVIALVAGLCVGALIGGVAAWFVARARASSADAHARSTAVAELEQARTQTEAHRALAAEARTQVAEARSDAAEARTEAATSREMAAKARELLAGERAGREAAERAAELAIERAKDLAADRQQLADQFDALSKRTLEAQSKQVDASAQQRFQETARLVEPVAKALDAFNQRLTEVEKTREAMSAELRTHVDHVRHSNEALRHETAKLATALRRPEVRGRWGEQQLRRVVESAGMLSHCDFDEQVSTMSGDKLLRPDMVINLAEGRRLFVDSKVPLDAFLAAAGTEDPVQHQQHLTQFTKHVQGHIDALGKKNYWNLADDDAPEFVVLFLPGENFFQTALEQVPDLYDYALKRNVVISGPFNLIALLRTIDLAWRQQAVVDNAKEVKRLGTELFERLQSMGKNFSTLGGNLKRAVDSYNATVGSLESRVMVAARKFEDLGISKPDQLGELESVAAEPRKLNDKKWPELDELQPGLPTVTELIALESSRGDSPHRDVG